VALPESVRAGLQLYLSSVSENVSGFAWVRAENLHLTLRFLGHIDPAQVEAVGSALESVRGRAFGVRLGGLGSFGGRNHTRVVWLAVTEGQQDLTDLASQVEQATVRAGLPGEGRPYRAHLTLGRARARGGAPRPELPPPPQLPDFRVADFVLYQSTLRPGGALYQPLRTYRLE
jgi:2'-5' RNA ligase